MAATKQIDVLFNTSTNSAGANKTINDLQRIEQQANRTREKMQKLAMVGNQMAMAGAIIFAPFALAMKKYVDSAKETEPLAAKIVELSEKWEASQVRIGRVAAEILLPSLEKSLDLIDKIAAFSEAHPDAVKAALGIGTSMILIGGAISAVGSIVSTLATIQGLAAGIGLAGGGAGAAGGTAAITTAITGIAPAVGATLLAIFTSPLTWAIAALALTVPIMNWLLGTETTWKDIATTGKQALFLVGMGIDKILRGLGSWFSNLGKTIWESLIRASEFIVGGIGGAVARTFGLVPKKDDGGMIGQGVFRNAGGREFVMNNSTTNAAEQMIGGSLTQGRLLAALAGGGGRRISYQDNRHIDTSLSMSQRRMLTNDILGALSGAL